MTISLSTLDFVVKQQFWVVEILHVRERLYMFCSLPEQVKHLLEWRPCI